MDNKTALQNALVEAKRGTKKFETTVLERKTDILKVFLDMLELESLIRYAQILSQSGNIKDENSGKELDFVEHLALRENIQSSLEKTFEDYLAVASHLLEVEKIVATDKKNAEACLLTANNQIFALKEERTRISESLKSPGVDRSAVLQKVYEYSEVISDTSAQIEKESDLMYKNTMGCLGLIELVMEVNENIVLGIPLMMTLNKLMLAKIAIQFFAVITLYTLIVGDLE